MALLEINNVSKHFGGLKAVDQVSISIEKGQIYGLIGPNGAGKTTLFNCVAGTYPPTSGTIVSVSYTHLRAHETPEHLVCRLLLEKKKIQQKKKNTKSQFYI